MTNGRLRHNSLAHHNGYWMCECGYENKDYEKMKQHKEEKKREEVRK